MTDLQKLLQNISKLSIDDIKALQEFYKGDENAMELLAKAIKDIELKALVKDFT